MGEDIERLEDLIYNNYSENSELKKEIFSFVENFEEETFLKYNFDNADKFFNNFINKMHLFGDYLVDEGLGGKLCGLFDFLINKKDFLYFPDKKLVSDLYCFAGEAKKSFVKKKVFNNEEKEYILESAFQNHLKAAELCDDVYSTILRYGHAAGAGLAMGELFWKQEKKVNNRLKKDELRKKILEWMELSLHYNKVVEKKIQELAKKNLTQNELLSIKQREVFVKGIIANIYRKMSVINKENRKYAKGNENEREIFVFLNLCVSNLTHAIKYNQKSIEKARDLLEEHYEELKIEEKMKLKSHIVLFLSYMGKNKINKLRDLSKLNDTSFRKKFNLAEEAYDEFWESFDETQNLLEEIKKPYVDEEVKDKFEKQLNENIILFYYNIAESEKELSKLHRRGGKKRKKLIEFALKHYNKFLEGYKTLPNQDLKKIDDVKTQIEFINNYLK